MTADKQNHFELDLNTPANIEAIQEASGSLYIPRIPTKDLERILSYIPSPEIFHLLCPHVAEKFMWTDTSNNRLYSVHKDRLDIFIQITPRSRGSAQQVGKVSSPIDMGHFIWAPTQELLKNKINHYQEEQLQKKSLLKNTPGDIMILEEYGGISPNEETAINSILGRMLFASQEIGLSSFEGYCTNTNEDTMLVNNKILHVVEKEWHELYRDLQNVFKTIKIANGTLLDKESLTFSTMAKQLCTERIKTFLNETARQRAVTQAMWNNRAEVLHTLEKTRDLQK